MKSKQTQVNFKLPLELYDYLKGISDKEFTNMTRYIVQLILEDKRRKDKEIIDNVIGLNK